MQKELIENNPILKLTLEFSVEIIDYCDLLQEQKKFVVSHQLLKAATAIGANCMEAQNAESRADFIHKMKIAAKETDETQYWLTLCDFANSYLDCKQLILKLIEISKVLNKILATSKRKNPISDVLSFFIF
jgi:four helix bundle protein